MTSDFYDIQFSDTGFDDFKGDSDRALIVVFDTSARNIDLALQSELAKDYIRETGLLILQGEKSAYFEEQADEVLCGFNDAFIPTVAVLDFCEIIDLVCGWEINRKKLIRVIAADNELYTRLNQKLA